MQVLVDAEGVIHGYGDFTAEPDPAYHLVDLNPDEISKLTEPGTKTLGDDGTVTVTQPLPSVPDPATEQRAQSVAVITKDPHFQQFTPEAQRAFLSLIGASPPPGGPG